ncbi:MAG: urease accessory protein UreE [Verrucomicrobia bacterium]|nr:urease accessory protein UreE [Verrucomicrobiota bacterium]
MRLIHAPLSEEEADCATTQRVVHLSVDRLRLAKRRWRGVAEDGTEFGFDLEKPLRHGTPFFKADSTLYRVSQLPEPIIEIEAPSAPGEFARLGWMLGNLHFPVEILPKSLRVSDDPAIRQMLLRERIAHSLSEAIFIPLAGAHSHGN